MSGTRLLILLLASACLIGCKDPGPTPADAATAAVKSIVACEIAKDWACVERGLDLDQKAAALFGETYKLGKPESKARTREILFDRFKIATPVQRDRWFDGAIGEIKIISAEASKVVLQELAPKEPVGFQYSVVKQGELWRVEERLKVRAGELLNPKTLTGPMVRQIEGELGRPPTLSEINEHIHGYLDGHRVRVMKLPGKEAVR
jgi:hypothetical protein